MLGGAVALLAIAVAAAVPSAANAYWGADGAGRYWWHESGGSLTDRWICVESYNRMVNSLVAAADEAVGTTIPVDIGAADAAAGATAWDGLSTASTALKMDAMETLVAEGAWPALSTMPSVALIGAAAGTAYVGWQIGTKIADFLGINASSGSSEGSGGVQIRPATVTNPLHLFPRGYDLVQQSGVNCASAPATCDWSHYRLPRPSWLLYWSRNGSGFSFGATFFDMPPGTATCSSIVMDRPPGGYWVETATYDQPAGTSCTVADPRGTTVACSRCVHERMYVIPATLPALPGPGQSQPAPVTQTFSSTFTQPSEDTMKRNAQSVLTSPDHDSWQRYFCSLNPDYCGGLPLPPESGSITTVVIPMPLTDETYAAYVTRLRAAGLLGTITKTVLSETAANPAVAPNAVVTTWPAPGSAVDPYTKLAVQVNPDTLSPPAGAGAPVGPALPGVSVPGAPTPCNIFPFGVPCWLGSQLVAFSSVSATAPSFSIGMPAAVCTRGCDLDVDLDHPFGADFSAIMAIVRPVLLVTSFIGLMLWTGGFALGGSTGGGGSSEE